MIFSRGRKFPNINLYINDCAIDFVPIFKFLSYLREETTMGTKYKTVNRKMQRGLATDEYSGI